MVPSSLNHGKLASYVFADDQFTYVLVADLLTDFVTGFERCVSGLTKPKEAYEEHSVSSIVCAYGLG